MAIVNMDRFTLIAFLANKEPLLKELQQFSEVHFRNLQETEAAKELTALGLSYDRPAGRLSEIESQLSKVRFALGLLEPYEVKLKGLAGMTAAPPEMTLEDFYAYAEKYDLDGLYDRLKNQDEALKRSLAEQVRLKSEQESLQQWRAFDVSPAQLSALKTTAYTIVTGNRLYVDHFREEVERAFPCAVLETVAQIKEDVAVFILAPAEQLDDVLSTARQLGFSRLPVQFADVPEKLIKQNETVIADLLRQEEAALAAMKDMGGEVPALRILGDCLQTLWKREKVCENFLKMDSVFVMEGWVPQDELALLESRVQAVCGENYLLESRPEDRDCPETPVKLKNNKLLWAFEDVTTMFSTPRYNEIDPTGVMAPFYMIFFGFMVGDMGYGLVLLIAMTVAICVLKKKGRFTKFLFYLSFPTLFAGFMYGSMFGVSVIKTPILSMSGSFITVLLGLSIGLGFFQIVFGLGVKGYMLLRDGHTAAAVFDSLFWITTLLSIAGLLLTTIGIVPNAVFEPSKWVFIFSLIGLAATQGRESPSIGGKIGNGLYAVYGLTSYIGDFVSYTRIVALGLSGAYIAYSFNLMAGLLPAGPVRWIAGGIIVVAGQAMNTGLSMLGAYVHSCRLQYVEYFGKFYEGGGVPFRPFNMQIESVTIKK